LAWRLLRKLYGTKEINFTQGGIKKHTRETYYCPTNVLEYTICCRQVTARPQDPSPGSSPAQFVLYTICSAKSSCYCNICLCPTSSHSG